MKADEASSRYTCICTRVSHHYKCNSVPAKTEVPSLCCNMASNFSDLEHEPKDSASDASDEESDKFVVSLLLTEEQRLAIKAFFGHNNWNYTETTSPEMAVPPEDDLDLEPGHIISQDPDAAECVYCLCRPCITDASNQQLWWDSEPQEAHERNSVIRKGLYKRFWTMLFHRGAWLDPRYKQKKADALQQDKNRQHYVWGGGKAHKRDIMPDCVLQCVRSWYPNPPRLQYMGHRWG